MISSGVVGEIRDVETAEIAIQAALTGHLVFSTLHTNDAAGGVTRLMHMGIQPYLIASAARAIIAQRLVRLICPECKEKVSDGGRGLLPNGGLTSYYRGKGCEACRFTGHKGRTAIYEILLINEAIREMILRRASSNEIKKEAARLGMKTLYQDGLKKVALGLTTPGNRNENRLRGDETLLRQTHNRLGKVFLKNRRSSRKFDDFLTLPAEFH